jgi:hypothetical protein
MMRTLAASAVAEADLREQLSVATAARQRGDLATLSTRLHQEAAERERQHKAEVRLTCRTTPHRTALQRSTQCHACQRCIADGCANVVHEPKPALWCF